MTAAQKTAKAKFKQAIAYRQKTGVSLKEAFAHIYGKKVGAVKKKAAPKNKAAKKVAKKVIRKVVKKKAAPKKKVAKKKLTRKDYDKRFQADKPGKRTSASGNTYYETRPNRSDKGKLLGIVKAKPTIIALSKKISRQTDFNQHNEAILSLAKFLKEKKSIELINYVIKMHNNYGYMPNELYDIANNIYKQLMILLKNKYGEIDYTLIKDSF
jgi:hypothetical protein